MLNKPLDGMRFASGKRTIEYDNLTVDQLAKAMFDLQENMVRIEVFMAGLDVMIEREGNLEYDVSTISHDLSTITAEMARTRKLTADFEMLVVMRLDRIEALAERILTSRFFRLVNFFTRWVKYEPGGSIHLEQDKGPGRSLLHRITRPLRRLFGGGRRIARGGTGEINTKHDNCEEEEECQHQTP